MNYFLNQGMKQSLISVTYRLGIQVCKEVRYPKINQNVRDRVVLIPLEYFTIFLLV